MNDKSCNRKFSIYAYAIYAIFVVLAVSTAITSYAIGKASASKEFIQLERNIITQEQSVRTQFDDIASVLVSCVNEIDSIATQIAPHAAEKPSEDELYAWTVYTTQTADNLKDCLKEFYASAKSYDIARLLSAAQSVYDATTHGLRDTFAYASAIDSDNYAIDDLKGNLRAIAGWRGDEFIADYDMIGAYNGSAAAFNLLISTKTGAEIANIRGITPYSVFRYGGIADMTLSYGY